ncbi:PREDICTED: uncharacterized protein LOC107172635 [Diuraphis noxia]|uniref:uncharacterized protein LOC107172635 n=1 Tax=Diuraphis noxia TaxID=143948 RepID=UPI0007638970|nr:PREDICTED: uncharacterized protein LOC107172635 [Diuraphis noxia]
MVETKKELEERRTIAKLKRESAIDGIKAVHAMTARVGTEPDFIPEFILNVDSLDVLWSQFKVDDNALLECLVKLNRASEYSVGQAGEISALINSARAVANLHRPTRSISVVDNNAGNTSRISDASQCLTFSRLPEIPLPKFGGDFHLWPTFRDRFTALVDVRPGLSNIDKLHYLTGCLRGAALDAIRGIPASDDNYKLVWSTLTSRFYRPRMVATSLIERLLNAPSSSQESLHDLTTLLTTFEENIPLLFALDIPDFGSFVLFSLAFRTLPLSVRKMFESTMSNNVTYPSVDKLLDFIRGRITVLENVSESKKTSNNPRAYTTTGSAPNLRSGQRNSVVLVAAKPPIQGSSDSIVSCPCCSNSHAISKCSKFRSWSLDDRNEWAHDNKLCFNCLGGNHWIRACPSKSRCQTCSKKHHTLLHGATSTRRENGVEDSEDAGEASCCAASLSTHPSAIPTVLLGTALIHTRDRAGTWQTVRALVDSASKISAMTVACSTRLGFRPRPWTMPVSGISGTPIVSVQGVVECHVRPRFASEPELTVRTWVLPSITSDMPRTSLPTDIKDRFSSLALADPQFDVTQPVDMLLGADVFSAILDGRKVKIDESLPTAFSSIFGWVLSGHSRRCLLVTSPHQCL